MGIEILPVETTIGYSSGTNDAYVMHVVPDDRTDENEKFVVQFMAKSPKRISSSIHGEVIVTVDDRSKEQVLLKGTFHVTDFTIRSGGTQTLEEKRNSAKRGVQIVLTALDDDELDDYDDLEKATVFPSADRVTVVNSFDEVKDSL